VFTLLQDKVPSDVNHVNRIVHCYLY